MIYEIEELSSVANLESSNGSEGTVDTEEEEIEGDRSRQNKNEG